MQHMRCSCSLVTPQELEALRKRYPALIQRAEQQYPQSEGNLYYEPQLRVRNGAAVFCPNCNCPLQYRDLRMVTRRLDAHRHEVFFLERCQCKNCRQHKCAGIPVYHTLYPDEVTSYFRYSENVVETAIDQFLIEHDQTHAQNGAETAEVTTTGVRSGHAGASSIRVVHTARNLLANTSDTNTTTSLLSTSAEFLSCLDQTDEKTIHRWNLWYSGLRTPILLALSLCPSAMKLIDEQPAISTYQVVVYLQQQPHWLQKAMSVFLHWNIPKFISTNKSDDNCRTSAHST